MRTLLVLVPPGALDEVSDDNNEDQHAKYDTHDDGHRVVDVLVPVVDQVRVPAHLQTVALDHRLPDGSENGEKGESRGQ